MFFIILLILDLICFDFHYFLDSHMGFPDFHGFHDSLIEFFKFYVFCYSNMQFYDFQGFHNSRVEFYSLFDFR